MWNGNTRAPWKRWSNCGEVEFQLPWTLHVHFILFFNMFSVLSPVKRFTRASDGGCGKGDLSENFLHAHNPLVVPPPPALEISFFPVPTSQCNRRFSLGSAGCFQLYVPQISMNHGDPRFFCQWFCHVEQSALTRHRGGPYQKEAKDVPLPYCILTAYLLLR